MYDALVEGGSKPAVLQVALLMMVIVMMMVVIIVVMREGVLVDLVDVRSESEIQNPSSSCWFPSRPSQGALAIKLQAQCTALGSRTFSACRPPMQYQRAEFLCLMQYRWAEFLCLMQCHRSTVVCTCREFQLEFLQYLRQLPQGSLIGKKVKGGERQNEMF